MPTMLLQPGEQKPSRRQQQCCHCRRSSSKTSTLTMVAMVMMIMMTLLGIAAASVDAAKIHRDNNESSNNRFSISHDNVADGHHKHYSSKIASIIQTYSSPTSTATTKDHEEEEDYKHDRLVVANGNERLDDSEYDDDDEEYDNDGDSTDMDQHVQQQQQQLRGRTVGEEGSSSSTTTARYLKSSKSYKSKSSKSDKSSSKKSKKTKKKGRRRRRRKPNRTILEIIVDNPNVVGTLGEVASLFPDLIDALGSNDETLTLFAPTNRAFEAIADVLPTLSDEEIANVLLYHAAGTLLPSSSLEDGIIEMTNGMGVIVDRQSRIHNTITLNTDSATVLQADVQATNGIIHLIDAVLLPPTQTIAEIATTAEGDIFSTLVSLLVQTGLVEAFDDAMDGPNTVFAPTNDAFAALPAGLVDSLSDEQVTDILLYHVSPGLVGSGNLTRVSSIETLLDGQSITVDNGGTRLNGNIGFLGVDSLATNGVVHIIDGVLIPEGVVA